MGLLIGSFWRAVAYGLHPRVIALSLLPLALMGVASFALGYFFWDRAVDAMLHWLESWSLVEFVFAWLDSVGLTGLRAVVAPLLVLVLATPLIVMGALLLVSLTMTPALVDWVAARRFPDLQRLRGASWWGSLAWSGWSTLLALLLLVITLPLWLIPPLALVLPALIGGWLTQRVLAFDALAEHASAAERRALMQRHRLPLLAMGVASGLLSAAPSVLWASGAMFIALAPLLLPLAIWIYTLVFALASLWFVHYLLAALAAQRAQGSVSGATPPACAPAPVPACASDRVIDAPARVLPPASPPPEPQS
ncbi:Etoposide-induced protein 2.4 (EI24) [Tepidimonas alkaliphilus]|uniref:Etoposide-induced protein 2.4 (EI24) n=1 Tax=Tepidimonas alkaliphilus TaxID=2588942 RepID=A0A554WCW0_9BURK|nr:EI24 domain-containing protein [Tepidimonas alkaliphilus]TSE21408.1 Etoposide-induced protein 2.4 (EI24) [Tepidimonas alkaliphilus]